MFKLYFQPFSNQTRLDKNVRFYGTVLKPVGTIYFRINNAKKLLILTIAEIDQK